jgi:hypothetical protein
MKKTLFTAALAFVLSLGGFVLSAEEEANTQASDSDLLKLVVASKTEAQTLIQGLSKLDESYIVNQNVLGYMDNGDFCSLATAIENAESKSATENATNLLGSFKDDFKSTYQFGYKENGKFEAVGPILNVASDPLFYGEFSSDGFYKLDFDENPFNGMIEIYVMGEPLPASTVTMLVALAAAGAFLLYRNRKTSARVASAQA